MNDFKYCQEFFMADFLILFSFKLKFLENQFHDRQYLCVI